MYNHACRQCNASLTPDSGLLFTEATVQYLRTIDTASSHSTSNNFYNQKTQVDLFTFSLLLLFLMMHDLFQFQEQLLNCW